MLCCAPSSIWRSGIRATMARLWPDSDADALLTLYHQLEPAMQAGRGIAYRTVMAEALATVASIAHLEIPAGEGNALASSLPGWCAFPEVFGALWELRRRGWQLAILSNTDDDLLRASLLARLTASCHTSSIPS